VSPEKLLTVDLDGRRCSFDESALLRVGVAHALLAIYDRVFFDRDLDVVYGDGELAERSKTELAAAIDRGIRASSTPM
jgi:hypothetical protein